MEKILFMTQPDKLWQKRVDDLATLSVPLTNRDQEKSRHVSTSPNVSSIRSRSRSTRSASTGSPSATSSAGKNASRYRECCPCMIYRHWKYHCEEIKPLEKEMKNRIICSET